MKPGFELPEASTKGFGDRPTATIVLDQSGDVPIVRKTTFSAFENTRAEEIAEFLGILTANPHPHLLVPISYEVEDPVAVHETYPKIDYPSLQECVRPIRNALVTGDVEASDITDIFLQITDAAAFMHRNGFAHQDIAPHNIFLGIENGRLRATLFDYDRINRLVSREQTTLVSPNVISPDIDVRMIGNVALALIQNDVVTLPYLVGEGHPLQAVIQRALYPTYYWDAGEMHEALQECAAHAY